MHLIDGAGHVDNLFVAEDIDAGRPPTEITADFMNAVQLEIAACIQNAGMSLQKTSNTQLRDALAATFARRDSTLHYRGEIYTIVADPETLSDVPTAGLQSGTRILVTSHYGLNQAAMATWINNAWNPEPVPLGVLDLYATTYDNHGYYWFAGAWNLFDVATMQVDPATEEAAGIVRLASWQEVLAGTLAAVLRPRHMLDYIDSIFVGSVADFPGTTPPSNLWLPMSGQFISRAERPLLWNYAQASGNIVVEASWSSNTGRFSTGNGSTNFRLPDLRGEFRRGWDNGRGVDAGRALGTWQNHQLQNHNHTVSYPSRQAPDGTTGSGVAVSDIDSGQDRGIFIVDAINANIGWETRPRSIAYLTCIYAGAPA